MLVVSLRRETGNSDLRWTTVVITEVMGIGFLKKKKKSFHALIL